MSENYLFLKGQRDSFIDFLKGLAIICVILTHNLPQQGKIIFCLWGAQAVPIFLIIQTYHAYNNIFKKKLSFKDHFSSKSVFKVYKRILLPFIYLLIIELLILGLIGKLDIWNFIKAGGYGPGSYYVWIYLQFFIIIPLLVPVFNKFNGISLFFIFVFISEFFELLLSYYHIPDFVYRLLFFRYFFLIYLGYVVCTEKFELNSRNIILSIISVIFILIDNYMNINWEPFIYNTAWKGFHWISYFYTLYIFLFLLRKIYLKINPTRLTLIVEKIGKYSYEIFLLQMFVFGFFPDSILPGINNAYIKVLSFIILTTMLSIIPVLIYKRYLSKYNHNV
jgi:Fucose 4-O-acetylase and related acetyltransferases